MPIVTNQPHGQLQPDLPPTIYSESIPNCVDFSPGRQTWFAKRHQLSVLDSCITANDEEPRQSRFKELRRRLGFTQSWLEKISVAKSMICQKQRTWFEGMQSGRRVFLPRILQSLFYKMREDPQVFDWSPSPRRRHIPRQPSWRRRF